MKRIIITAVMFSVSAMTTIIFDGCKNKKHIEIEIANPISESDTTGQSDPMHQAADSLAKIGGDFE